MSAALKLEAHPLFSKSTIEAFIKGIKDTLGTMASTEVVAGKPHIENHFEMKGDVAAIVGLIAPPLKGNFIISFEKKGILQVYKNMVGEEKEDLNDEIKDAIGEIANMVYGSSKTLLNEKGNNFQMALPTVVLGEYFPAKDHQGVTLVIPFHFQPDQKLFVQITVNN
ncbi:MAG: chemotaxis protein CheX [Bdellovibrionales bacterium]